MFYTIKNDNFLRISHFYVLGNDGGHALSKKN